MKKTIAKNIRWKDVDFTNGAYCYDCGAKFANDMVGRGDWADKLVGAGDGVYFHCPDCNGRCDVAIIREDF